MRQLFKGTRVLVILLCLLFMARHAWTQTISASKSGPYCPGETITYEAYGNETGLR